MYLARVEMTGFKSFADKTVIEFDRGMTAVVGPNGSGKSNLSEAIRWVLGEQSAKSLRGSKMEDVIFNGTQDRKPVNLAKVTLVLNNEDRYLDLDFSEISITRSYNRNGDSNYYINNESVRLKDIVDLLLDSGLGKNSFAMISQGKVESIFLNKPEERRSIFEEAAGVQKYQFRKIEAERKLLKSNDHLSRVKDIIHELEGQLKPLKKQKETALKFQEYQEQLSNLEISLFTYQIEQNRTKWEASKNKLTTIENEINLDQQKLGDINQDINQKSNELDQLLVKIDQNTETFQGLVRKLEQAKAKLQILQQELHFSQTTTKDKLSQFENQLVQKERIDALFKDAIAKKQGLSQAIESISDELIDYEKERQVASGLSDEQVNTLRNEMIQYYQAEASAKNEMNQLSQKIEQENYRLERLNNKNNQLMISLSECEKELTEKNQLLSTEQSLLASHHQQHEKLQQEWQLIQQNRSALQKSVFEIERQVNINQHRLKSLKQMQEQYEGYFGGVRFVMQHAAEIKGIEGTIAELIKVPVDYQIAIDTALGGALQHIVVEDDAAARRAIQYLKEHRAGRATFLPRPNIKPRSLSDNLLTKAQNHRGFVGMASELIEFDATNQNIMGNLLGNTIIIDKIENAQTLSRSLNFQAKIVTLDGELLMPGGSVSGGRQKQQGNSMLSRQSEIELAQNQLQASEKQKTDLIQQLSDLEIKEQEIKVKGEESRDLVNQVEIKVNALQQKLQQIQQLFSNQTNEMTIVKYDQEEAEKAIEEAKKKLNIANQTISEMTLLIDKGNNTLEQLNVSQSERQIRVNELTAIISKLSTDKAVKQSELKQTNVQIEQYNAQIEQLNQLIEHYQANRVTSEQDIEQLNETIEEVQGQIILLEQDQNNLENSIETSKQYRSDLNSQIRMIENNKEQIQEKQQGRYQLQAKLQANIEKFEELIDDHLIYLSETYQLSYEAAVKQATTVEEIDDVSKKVKKLRKLIEELGPTNIAAVEDFDNLNERYSYLVEQQEDLVTAMGQLKETMDTMDAEVIKRFSEAFYQINHQFKRTFRTLFGGGEASLELTDPDNLLTTGVDIIAQPPGKKKQNLALLSGGERAFTAIALLFAILETKPVPFCVLDEVEAALDDANVWRYGEYLKQFTENTQFIVITHRKGTMEHADVLYGVTMERSGISKLASVRLSNASMDNN